MRMADKLGARRSVVGPLLLCALGACAPGAEQGDVATEAEPAFLDPVVQDGEHYQLELENDWVRVIRENVPAGTEVVLHSHRERVSVFLNDAEVTLAPRGGEPARIELESGTLRWDPPVTHSGRVHSTVENLSIELKPLEGAEIPLPEPDAVAVDPDHHVVDFENDLVRVVRMTYPAGFSTPLHAHRPGFGVFLTDALGQNVPEEGELVPIEAEARSTFWTEGGAPPHVTENSGEEELVVILVEMKKRP